MSDYKTQTKTEIESSLNTILATGLTEQEASLRLTKNGKNLLPNKKPTPAILIFFKSFFQPIQIILFIAAIISIIAPLIAQKNFSLHFENFIDFLVIMFVIILDALLSTVQEVKARKSVDALKSLSKPTAIVLRESVTKEIDASNLVVGDIVLLEAGKYVPAELRLIEANDCMIDESILTGESISVEKTDQPIKPTKILSSMKNTAFMSTFVTSGRAIGVVIGTGTDTEIGKISQSISENENQITPLGRKINKFSYLISFIAVVVSVFVFLLFLFTGNKNNWANYLMIAITLAIGVIPESLSAIVSITLSFATKRMVKENVIVKKLESIETLGSVNVICTDKTGTLTQNRMAIQKLIWNNQIISSQEFINLNTNASKELFLKALVLPNDSITENGERIGDPTELALVDFAEMMNVDEQDFRKKYQRIDEIVFDSERKLMTTVNQLDDQKVVFTKGALDQLLKKCTKIYLNNKIINLTSAHKKEIKKASTSLSDDALRVLGFAYKILVNDNNNYESELIFIGATAMIDPVRPEAVLAVAEAKKAGIKVIMITGDHATTALAIAKELDLAFTSYEVLTSEKLEQYTDKELESAIDNIKIFARVNPEHKVRIVQALQNKGYIVAMTGDGVNDAPSLSKADIGVAMGITGTDVAKQAADAILTDDNFKTIIKGVIEGRNVFQKIRRAIVLLLGFNFANVFTIILSSLILKVSPLEATNILFINLVVDSCLAFGIGMSPLDDSLMLLKPQKKTAGILKDLIWPIFQIALSLSAAQIISFIIAMQATDMQHWNSIQDYQFKTDNWFLFIQNNNLELSKNISNINNFIVFGRTGMFITSIIAPCFFAHLIKLTNWKATKKIDLTISKPLIIGSVVVILISILAFCIPGVNSTVFGLAAINKEPHLSWNKNNFWILFTSLACALIPTLFKLITDTIQFYSYHLSSRDWENNQKLISQLIEQDSKSQVFNKQKKNNH
ncbi:cation-translocating P-type ATPase [Mycoplasma putrefaciens]|uniref:Cation-transporting ATPase n=1 Tax=Mycoplasma putrefaciens Mput9231 TaxID=1292033 RepID=M9WC06_9MOLU|nr:cation-translocating P-type ATPase [Mycoplasma putrefaciens]AGJ90697.1 Cation-transporting ATPase [Mycoplasma putrefaciens Mput9231]